MAISETVLEMHYHQPLMKLIRETYGVGPTGKFSFFKYSPQKEVFLGFDQAYAMTEISDEDFFEQMKSSAMENGYKLKRTFVAYFLQFKVVNELQKNQKKNPPQIRSKPYYRASLDTTKNDNTGFSQHELLYNLSKNHGAMVYYACPMLFDKAALYEVEVSLEPLRLVDFSSCPSEFSDNSKHYIYFDQRQSDPIWCSEPVVGRAIKADEFATLLVSRLRQSSTDEAIGQVAKLLAQIKSSSGNLPEQISGNESAANGLVQFADALTVIRLDEVIGEA
ncbi:hypothetical protein KDM87_12680 [Undibacterium sp. FT147W]|uniref:Uncharacterized protein n=1 Tax=Undibacterium rivi TaxID=2828729 RepID=A0ABS5H4Y3_9BURK|nr:hypothetical protein [Undibacterium rivi]MBR7793454.1 hypothetical protein [Undibacterium rivi]